MSQLMESMKKAEITMRLSEFEVPPMQDILIVGKKAPIGLEAARRIVDTMSPEQYEVVNIEHEAIEALVIRKALMNMVDKEKLIALILDEGGKIASESTIIKAQINIVLHVSKSIDI